MCSPRSQGRVCPVWTVLTRLMPRSGQGRSSSFQQLPAPRSQWVPGPGETLPPTTGQRAPIAVASWLPQPLPRPLVAEAVSPVTGPTGVMRYGASAPLLWLRAPARAFRGEGAVRAARPLGGHPPPLLGPQAWASSHRGPTLSPRRERFGFLIGKPEGKLSPPTGGCHMPLHPAQDPATPMAASNCLHRRRD